MPAPVLAPVIVPVPSARARWARDLAIIGGVTSVVAPAFAGMTILQYLVTAGLTGAATGLALGALLGGMQARLLRVPLWLLVLGALVAGGIWGGATGAAAGASIARLEYGGIYLAFSAICGAICGAAQLGWLYVPYANASATGRSTAPLVLAACVFACGAGVGSIRLLELF